MVFCSLLHLFSRQLLAESATYVTINAFDYDLEKMVAMLACSFFDGHTDLGE
jgi:hypothetical protein